MYFKLALNNVKKSFKDYMIYFLTLAFSVCLFYSFNSFQSQQAVLEMSEAQLGIINSIQTLMNMLSVIVAIILGFLIIYANNFLIKRRKKELGIYTLLGMKKQVISRILVYETFIIGLLSLLTGLLAGLLLSQLLTVVTANLFEVVLNYHFVYSPDATILTIVAFAIIFLIIMIFHTFALNRYKLIDLLTADKKNETFKVKNIYVSILLFLLSLGLLGFAYWYSLSSGFDALMKLNIIAPAGILGTLLFFMSLSGFLLKFVQSSKKLYYRKLNMFVLRQINASINSNFVSMSIVCIMLLFSIGALSTGTNLNRTINNAIHLTTPYDITYVSNYRDGDYAQDISTIITDLGIEEQQLKSSSFVHDYNSDCPMNIFTPYLDDNILLTENVYNESFEVLPLSEFNHLREVYGYEPISLNANEAYMFTSYDMLRDTIMNILKQDVSFTLYGNEVQIINHDFEYVNLGTTYDISTFMFGVVVQDELIPDTATMHSMYWNANLKEDVSSSDFVTDMNTKIQTYTDLHKHSDGSDQAGITYHLANVSDAQHVRENSKGLSVIMTYIGLYLGIVFLITSAVILALQQLSQAADNKQRYQILHKIGAEKHMISQSIFMQLSIYFFMPLLLGIIHSIVGIQVVNVIVQVFGASDIFHASLITSSIIILIYGTYFLITYIGYKRILYKG